jgi:hypothetical protein
VTQLAATPPPAADLLTAWEVGRRASTAQRSVLLLGALAPQLDGDALLGLSLGDRDARLLAAHRQLFGPELECVVRCPACGADLELALAVDALPASAADDAEAVVETGEWRVVVRALTLGDVLDAGAAEDLAAARRVLLARAVVSATGPEEALPAAVEAAVEAELPGLRARLDRAAGPARLHLGRGRRLGAADADRGPRAGDGLRLARGRHPRAERPAPRRLPGAGRPWLSTWPGSPPA